MLTVKKALKIILDHTKILGNEEIHISESLGRILAEKIYADADSPPFDKSSMDGFAIKSSDSSETFEVIEDIPAGFVPQKKITKGKCTRIMTGAIVPQGADLVVPKEYTIQIKEDKIQIAKFPQKSNISKKGENIKKGHVSIFSKSIIRPQEIAIMATTGKTTVKVFKLPKVSVISTGSELVEPTDIPNNGQIRNSNSYMLLAQLKQLGINATYLGIAKDNFAITIDLIKKGIDQSDILILSGGVSVGDYDFVKEALEKHGVEILFDKIAIKPGKPTIFAIKEGKYIFGLPGNPVSAFIAFELFVVPFIEKLTNAHIIDKFKKIKLGEDFERKKADREEYRPVIIFGNTDPHIYSTKFHGSGDIYSLGVTGLMKIEKGVKRIKKGEHVDVRSI